MPVTLPVHAPQRHTLRNTHLSSKKMSQGTPRDIARSFCSSAKNIIPGGDWRQKRYKVSLHRSQGVITQVTRLFTHHDHIWRGLGVGAPHGRGMIDALLVVHCPLLVKRAWTPSRQYMCAGMSGNSYSWCVGLIGQFVARVCMSAF